MMMHKQKTKIKWFSPICILLGSILVLISLGYLVGSLISNRVSAKDNREIVLKLEEKIPDIVDSFPEERGNPYMSSLEIDGVNVAALLEFPRFDSKLPIRSGWDKKAANGMPCRYTGSIHGKDLMIGGTDGKDQIDFAKQIETEDILYLTDMEGLRYTYSVTAIKHSSQMDAERWLKEESDFTLFVKDTLSGEYTVVYCMAR